MYCDQCGQPLPPGEPGPAHAVCPNRPPAAAHPRPPVLPGQWHLGRPSDWPRVKTLVAAAFLRNWAGTISGITACWFGVPFLILMVALGAIVGGLLGFVQNTIMGDGVAERVHLFFEWVLPLPVPVADLAPTDWYQFLTFGVLGAVTGAVYGAIVLGWASLVWPWEAAYAVDPTWPVGFAFGQVAFALTLGAAYTLWAVVCERWRMKLGGARAPSDREAALLEPIVDACAEALSLAGRPVLLISDSHEFNAFAGFRHLVITDGLMRGVDYDRDRLGGVVAHELAHWRDGDAVGLTWSRGVALPLYWAYELSVKLVKASERHRPLQMVVRIATWAIRVTVERLVIPVQARHWRQAEYRADQAAVACGYRDGLRAVLEHIRESFDGDGSGWSQAICRTHPPSEERLRRLQEPGRKYELGRAAAPSWAPAGPALIRTGW